MSARPAKLLFGTALLACLAMPASGAEAGRTQPSPSDTVRLTLPEAVQRALARGEEMRTARAGVHQTEGQVREQLARALPQISGTLTYTRQLQSIFQGSVPDTSVFGELLKNSPFAAENTWNLTLTGQQLLWSSGKVGAALGAARSANRSAHATSREIELDVTFSVRRAYLDAAYAQRLVAIAESSLAQARAHLAQVRLEQGQGSRSEYELLRAEVDAANAEPALVAAKNGVDLALLALRRLVNVPATQPLALMTPLEFPDDQVPVPADDTLSVALRPAIAAANAEVEARRQAVRVYRGQYWPDLYLSSTISQQAFPPEVWPNRHEFRRDWNAALRIEIPIFNGLRTAGQVQQARAELERATANRDLTKELAGIEAAQARADLERSLATLTARRGTVRQARRAADLAGVRYGNGMSTQLEVTDARVQLQTAEVNEVQATRDYLLALFGLERAVGRSVPVVRIPVDQAARPSTEGTTR